MTTRFKGALPALTVLGPVFALLAAGIFFACQSDRFLSGQNFSLILQQVMVVGGIDLSCGMAMALGSVVATKFAVDYGLSPLLAVPCGMLACILIGYVNGVLVTAIRLPPFIVTLGTLPAALALALT